MDKEGRGQEPWTTFQYVCSIDPHVASRLIQGLSIRPFIRVFARFMCNDMSTPISRIGLYTCAFRPLSKRWKRWVVGWREREKEVGGILGE